MKEIETHRFRGPTKIHWFFFSVCVLGIVAFVGRQTSEVYGTSRLNDDLPYFLVIVVASIFFLYKALKPRVMIAFSEKGIQHKDEAPIPWSVIQFISIEKRRGYKGIINDYLIVRHSYSRELAVDFYDLKAKPKEIMDFLKMNYSDFLK